MKTKEFIKRVEQLGYLVNEGHVDWQISRISKGQDLLVAIVNKNNLSRISTDFVGWWDISDEDKSKLLDIIVEFAKTPIEDREEENKFYLKHKWFMTEFGDTFYLCKCYNAVGNISYAIRLSYITHDETWLFTLKEIEEIKERFDTDLADFELVEVKDDN